MAPRPGNYLGWVPSGNPLYVQQPPLGQLSTGWLAGQPPPFQFDNYALYLLDQWVQYLDGITSTGGIFRNDSIGDVTIATGFSLFNPYLTIEPGNTYEVSSGAELVSVTSLTVLGTLIVDSGGEVRVL